MPFSIIIFGISLIALASMIASKWMAMDRGTSGFVSRMLSRFDASLSIYLRRLGLFSRLLLAFLWAEGLKVARSAQSSFFSSTHKLLQNAERRMRQWRDFAREQHIKPKAASSCLKDVVDYKATLKNHQPL